MENYYCGDLINTGNHITMEDVVMYFNIVNDKVSLEDLSNKQKRLLNILNSETFTSPDNENLNSLYKMLHGEIDPILCKDALTQCCNNKIQIPTYGWDDDTSRESVNGVSVSGFESNGMLCIDMTGTTADALAYPFGFIIKKENDEELLGKIMSTTNLMGKTVVYLTQTGYYETTISSNTGAFDNELIYLGGCEFNGNNSQQPPVETQTQTKTPTKTPTKTLTPSKNVKQPSQTKTQTPTKTPTKTPTPNLFGGTWVNKATINNEKSYSYGSVRWRNDGRMFALSTDSQFPPGVSSSQISGFVRLYQYDDTNNSLSPTGNILNGYGTGDKFGAGLSINGIGSRVAAGAPSFPNNNDQSSYAGRVGVYTAGAWSTVGNLINGSPSDNCGNRVDLNDEGNRLLVASNNEDVNGLDSAGAVRIYDLINNTWTQVGQTLEAEQSVEVFGGSAVISGDGNTVAISSWQYNDGPNINVGRVVVYSLVNNEWVQKGEQFTGQVGKRLLGEIAISHDGNIITFGNQNNSEPSIVNQYKFENSQWNKVGNDIVLPVGLWGHRLKMSADNKTIVIGAENYNESATENQVSGMVRVYRLSGNTWLQLGQDIKGSIVNQKLGHDVDITNDGLRLVILSRYFDESKPMEATVYYYEV